MPEPDPRAEFHQARPGRRVSAGRTSSCRRKLSSIRPAASRRAANPSACADARSSHCSSSTTQISGRSEATSDTTQHRQAHQEPVQHRVRAETERGLLSGGSRCLDTVRLLAGRLDILVSAGAEEETGPTPFADLTPEQI